MKKTDPANLRVPALKLLAELLPTGATAGVWLFDTDVIPLLPAATIDAKWKERARERAQRIHSNGLYTNIETALAAASADWDRVTTAETSSRHVVLLTDGIVDVGPDSAASAASRERVLGAVLADLQAKGAHVHGVALSPDVDRALLDALAAATHGWREDAPDATALQRAFLRIFEQTAAPDTLPLKGTRFRVDDDVRELTLLVFRGHGATGPLTLEDPTGAVWSAATPTPRSRWQSEAGYDLVTIESPTSGEWQFSGTPDPDNRALIVTDLDLAVDDLPATALPGESLTVAARLLERGRAIERDEFLTLTRATVAVLGGAGVEDPHELSFDPARHVFHRQLEAALPAGAYEVVVRVESATFERETRRHLRIHSSPVAFKTVAKPAASGDGARLRVGLAINTKVIDPRTVGGYILATGPDARRIAAEIPELTNDRAVIDLPVAVGGAWRVAPTIFATGVSGRSLRIAPAPMDVTVDAPEPSASPPAATPQPSWLRAAAFVIGGNFAVGALLGPLWWVQRRRPLAPPEIPL